MVNPPSMLIHASAPCGAQGLRFLHVRQTQHVASKGCLDYEPEELPGCSITPKEDFPIV